MTPIRPAPVRNPLCRGNGPAAPGRWTAPRSRAGFTLIEVLLALAVCAVVLVGINAVLVSSLQMQRQTTEAIEESLPLHHALNLMRRDLRNAVPPGSYLAGPMQSGLLDGTFAENEGIHFYTTTGRLSDGAPWGDIQRIGYQLQSPSQPAPDGGKDLVRLVTRNLLPTLIEEVEEQWLAGGIERMEFYYFDGFNWLETWDALVQTNLPAAVRVEIVPVPRNDTANRLALRPVQLVVPTMARIQAGEETFWDESEGEVDEDY